MNLPLFADAMGISDPEQSPCPHLFRSIRTICKDPLPGYIRREPGR